MPPRERGRDRERERERPNRPRPRRGLRKTESGGETISITISVNGVRKWSRNATITTAQGNDRFRYISGSKRPFVVRRNQNIYTAIARELLDG